jgi:hypothetical protein
MEQHPLAFTPGGTQGDGLYRAPNPPFGANFTYYLAEDIPSLKDVREKSEQKSTKTGDDTPFPGFDAITRELREEAPAIWLTVRDSDGNVVRRLKGPASKGFNRVNWDLRYPVTNMTQPFGENGKVPSGFLVAPGEYTVDLSKRVRGVTTPLVAPKPFRLKPMGEGALPRQPDAQAFVREVAAFDRSVTATNRTLEDLRKKIDLLAVAVASAPGGDPAKLDNQLAAIRGEVQALDELLNGNPARRTIYERNLPTVRSRLLHAMYSIYGSTYGPTQTARDQLGHARAEYGPVLARVKALSETTIPAFEAELMALGAPWVPGGSIPAAE